MVLTKYIAHPDTDINRGNHQSVEQHLFAVSDLAAEFAKKIGYEEAGRLIGLLHDFGKYSSAFQRYIRNVTGISNPDVDQVDGGNGRVDHSTAGAQFLFNEMKALYQTATISAAEKKVAAALVQTLPLCIAAHHTGLLDICPSEKITSFRDRLVKADESTHLSECERKADKAVIDSAKALMSSDWFEKSVKQLTLLIGHQNEVEQSYFLGMFCKFLFSCLIDADRIDSADFELPENKSHRAYRADWGKAAKRIEAFLEGFQGSRPIDKIRRSISDQCRRAAAQPQGVYSLSVPTGGGKTYASLRYAIHHANQHGLDRIIYIIPFTSIIDQNAEVIRKVFSGDGFENWVLEHHSNLEPEQQTWRSKLVSQNWDAPIVLTTMVQFLESLFSGGTRGSRRLHQLAKSVIVFDEIQTLPVNCVHLFNQSINFLTTHCGTTALMCTATQPLLHKMKKPDLGQLKLPESNEIVSDVNQLFAQLKRVEIVDKTKPSGWQKGEIAGLALEQTNKQLSTLVIVNTKKWAQELFLEIQCSNEIDDASLFHLSTAQCPAHRQQILAEIRQRLDAKLPVICISTQLIEAGVDVDFGCVIRFLAGFDSIAQAAGRCNRNGDRELSQVYVVNPAQESIDMLIDIKEGQRAAERVMREFPEKELLTPAAMARYFQLFFYERSDVMIYPLQSKAADRDDSLLSLLSENSKHSLRNPSSLMNHSFMTAGRAFKAIDAPTKSLIVPYGEGKALIGELCSLDVNFQAQQYFDVLKKLQKYSVNLFPNTWERLSKQQAIISLESSDGVYYLVNNFYSNDFGVCNHEINDSKLNASDELVF